MATSMSRSQRRATATNRLHCSASKVESLTHCRASDGGGEDRVFTPRAMTTRQDCLAESVVAASTRIVEQLAAAAGFLFPRNCP